MTPILPAATHRVETRRVTIHRTVIRLTGTIHLHRRQTVTARSATARASTSMGRKGDGSGEFDAPAGVERAIDGSGLITDANNHRVINFLGRSFRGTFGEFGEGNGQFLRPIGIAVNRTSGAIYVTDIDMHRIQRFSRNVVFELAFGTFGSGIEQFKNPHGIAIDQQTGQVYVIDTNNERGQRLSEDLFPLGRFGRMGNGPGEFNGPTGIVAVGDGGFAVSDSGNHRVQVFLLAGVTTNRLALGTTPRKGERRKASGARSRSRK